MHRKAYQKNYYLMKKIDITFENYEAFILDRIEGRLTSEEDVALTDFMKRNGIANFQQNDLFYYDSKGESDKKSYSKVSFNHLKRNKPSIEEEELMFGAVEGTIHDKELGRLNNWLEQDDILRQHFDAMKATKLMPDKSLIYSHKNELKKKGVIRRFIYVAVAASILGLMLTIGLNGYLNYNVETPPIAVKTNESLINETKISSTIDNASEVAENSFKTVTSNQGQNNLTSSNQGFKSTKQQALAYERQKYIDEKNTLTADIKPDITDLNEKSFLNQVDNSEIEITSNEMKSVDRTQPLLPRIARLGLSRIVSESRYRIDDIALGQRKETKIEQPMVLQGIKQRIEYLDRKSAAIYGFVENQRGIIKSEGLFDIASTYDEKGKFDGLAIRIAGFEISTAK